MIFLNISFLFSRDISGAKKVLDRAARKNTDMHQQYKPDESYQYSSLIFLSASLPQLS